MNNQTGLEEVNSFGDWLRQRRKTLDWSQAVLAQRAGCTAATIRKIEADERKPSWQLAELLATALGIPADGRTTFVQAARQLRPVPQLPPANQAPVAAGPFPLSSPTFPHNLPASMTSLVDRVRDAATVVQLLKRADVRLLTLLGPPGIGKTRLSIYTAEQLATHFRDGIWFVDLAPINDASLVLSAIAYVLSVAEVGITPLLDRLRTTLAEKELLLVLDNFEQVSAAAPEVATLLRGCKGLKVLATSRTPLLLAGEHEYAVPPLSLPPSTLVSDSASENLPEKLLSYEAVQLFVARVRQVQHNFAITATNAAQISTICLRLDGIPLALELAAAALRRTTLPQLAAMFQHEASWLVELHSPARDLPPRQQTLRNAIAWSYRLLDADAQRAFRQVGIFVGGFTADAAQAICGADQSTLAHLTDHSLLARAPERWRMLEMIREFALAQMSNEERAITQQRHAAYFVTQPVTNLDRIAGDYANFRAALDWAMRAQDVHAALTLCVNLCWFWETRGYLSEGIKLGRAALAMLARGDVDLRIDALERVSTLAWQSHQLDIALQFAVEAATLARRHDRPGKLALTLNLLGRVLIEQGDYAQAETTLQESAQLARQNTHLFNPGCPLTMLGELALMHQNWEAAQAHLLQALPFLDREVDSLYVGVFVAMAHTYLAEVALANGNPYQARHELRQALPQACLYIRRLRCLLVTLAGLLLTTLHTTTAEDAQAAVAFLGAEAGLGEQTDAPSLLLYQPLIAQRRAHTQQLLPQLEWQSAWEIGYTWTLAQAVAAAERWLALDDVE